MKSEVAEVSESENSQHVEETWTQASSPKPSSSSEVNTIRRLGCADESLWIFCLEDSTNHQRTVSWDESWPVNYEQADEHELVTDSQCFGYVCPPWFAQQYLVVSASNVEAVPANDVALQHYGQKVVYGDVTTTKAD